MLIIVTSKKRSAAVKRVADEMTADVTENEVTKIMKNSTSKRKTQS